MTKRPLLASTAALATLAASPPASAQTPSPEWSQAVPSGPIVDTEIIEDYARWSPRVSKD
jgi:hypothetical protein